MLVEVIFGYPGIGALLFQAIQENDQFLIQGIVFTVIVALGLATFFLDMFYPLARSTHFVSANVTRMLRYLKRNPSLVVGIGLLSILAVFLLVGRLF